MDLQPAQPDRAPGAVTNDDAGALASRGRRELILFLALVACGLVLVPLLVWVVGQAVLGPYANGNAAALLRDFFAGLKSGSLLYWAIVFGPYVIVMLVRGLWYLLRKADQDEAPPARPAARRIEPKM